MQSADLSRFVFHLPELALHLRLIRSAGKLFAR